MPAHTTLLVSKILQQNTKHTQIEFISCILFDSFYFFYFKLFGCKWLTFDFYVSESFSPNSIDDICHSKSLTYHLLGNKNKKMSLNFFFLFFSPDQFGEFVYIQYEFVYPIEE